MPYVLAHARGGWWCSCVRVLSESVASGGHHGQTDTRDGARRGQTVVVVATPELAPSLDLRRGDEGVWNVIIDHQLVRWNARASRWCSEDPSRRTGPRLARDCREPSGRPRTAFGTTKSFPSPVFCFSQLVYTICIAYQPIFSVCGANPAARDLS